MSEMHFGKFPKMATVESVGICLVHSSVGSTIALYILHFVKTEIQCCDHTRFYNSPKAPEAA